MTSHQPKVSKRLERLIKAGICPAEDVSQYAKELKQLANKFSNTDLIRKQSKLFGALADETRLRILKLLSIREMCVCEIMVALNLTQPTASHHLNLLENAELVKHRKDGKWVFYRITNMKAVKEIQKINFS
jgi:ArsR family transcriptional regulator